MAKCYKCGEKISYKTILKSYLLGWGDIKCSNCKTENSHSIKNRLLGMIAVVLFFFINFFGMKINNVVAMVSAIIAALAVMLIIPPFFKFDKKE